MIGCIWYNCFIIHILEFALNMYNRPAGMQGDHSSDTVKFPDNSLTIHSTPVYDKCYSYHAGTNSMLLNTDMDANMQLTINSFWPIFHNKIFSLTYSKIPDISLTGVKIPDISRFSRQVVILDMIYRDNWVGLTCLVANTPLNRSYVPSLL